MVCLCPSVEGALSVLIASGVGDVRSLSALRSPTSSRQCHASLPTITASMTRNTAFPGIRRPRGDGGAGRLLAVDWDLSRWWYVSLANTMVPGKHQVVAVRVRVAVHPCSLCASLLARVRWVLLGMTCLCSRGERAPDYILAHLCVRAVSGVRIPTICLRSGHGRVTLICANQLSEQCRRGATMARRMFSLTNPQSRVTRFRPDG